MNRSAAIFGALLFGYGLITIILQIKAPRPTRRRNRHSPTLQYLYGALMMAAGILLLSAGVFQRH